MNTKGIRLAALDLDGTLLHEDKTISDHTLSVLEKLTKDGILVEPATGRNLEGLRDNILRVPNISYAVCSNGAQVFRLSDQKLLYEAAIPLEDAVSVIRYLQIFPTFIYVHTEKGTFRSGNWRDTNLKKRFPFIRFEENNVADLPAFLSEKRLRVIKIGVFVLDDGIFRRLLEKESPIPSISQFRTGPCNLELNAAGASKAYGVEALCRHLNLAMSQVLAMGDNQNDISLLRAAGVSVAMGNSEEDVKAAAGFVTGTNEADGAAEFLGRYFSLTPAPGQE